MKPNRRHFNRWDAAFSYLRLLSTGACLFIFVSLGYSQDKIRYGDIIDIDIDSGFEFDWRGGIDPEGNLEGITPYGDLLPAVCKTESELAVAVQDRLKTVLREPRARVRIIDRSNRAVAILEGSIRTATRFLISRDVRLLELIVMAGGLTDDASGDIQHFRPDALNCEKGTSGNPSQFTNIRITDLVAGKQTANPLIRSGDIVSIQTADEIYVIGGVENPRSLSARTQLTVSRAIAASGGISKRSDGKVVIYRRDQNETKLIEADLNAIAAGSADDVPLKAFDIVDVRGKGEGLRKFVPILNGRNRPTVGQLPLKIVDQGLY